MRIVVKVGTSTLAHSTGRLNIRHTEDLVKVLSDLKNAGHEVILVSSGAIGMGVGKLSLPARPTDMSTKQACAAGADLINDTWAGADPELLHAAAELGAGYVVSHTGGLPPCTDPVAPRYDPEPDGIVDDVCATLQTGADRALAAAGL